jgi:hypothetical protein
MSEESFLPEQLDLYATIPPAPGSLNDESVVRGIVTNVIRKSAKSREEIADQMSLLCGDRITVRMLNSYTSEAAEQHRWPAQYTRALCQVVDDWTLLRCITERSGFHLITDDDAQLLELGRQFLIRKRADEQISLLEAQLHGRGL